MLATVTPLTLVTRDRFTIARGGSSEWQTVVLAVEEEGLRAYGEGAPRSYYGESVAGCAAAISSFCAPGRSLLASEPTAIDALGARSRAAQAAVDGAWHDLRAQREGVPVHELLRRRHGLAARPGGGWPVSTYTIGLDQPARMAEKARAVADWPALKIKLGSASPDAVAADAARLRAVRAATSAELRVDANAAWTVARAEATVPVLVECGVTLVEQPLAAADLEGYRALGASRFPLPVYADESCRTLQDLEALAGAVRGVNLKLAKCGGLDACARMVRRARELGLGVMVGCFIETSIAITTAAALGPFVDFLDLDGAALLGRDPYRGVRLERGELVLPPGPGLGVSPR